MADNEVRLSTFPSNKTEALTMLYLQSQDLSNASPVHLVDMYNEVYSQISGTFKERRKASVNYLK